MTRILDGKRIQYQLVDISQDNALRDGDASLGPATLGHPTPDCSRDQYCGVWASGLGVEETYRRTLA